MTAPSVPVSGRSVPHPQPLPAGMHVLGEQPEATDGDGGRSYAAAVAHQQSRTSHRALLRLGRRCSPFNCICGDAFLDARQLAGHLRGVRDAA